MDKSFFKIAMTVILLFLLNPSVIGQTGNASLKGNHQGKEPKIAQTLIYENLFNQSEDEWLTEMQEEWVLEGKGITRCGDGYLSLRSEIFTVPRDNDGHFNLWLKRDFPANVAFEWDFRYSEPGEEGLAIIIWAAMGRNGEDIFDPALPVRRGEVMSDFHTGALNCYHTSYIARGRKTANLRKNYGFHVLTNGYDLSTVSKPEEWHKIRLEQCNGTIRLLFDGKETYSYTDDRTIGGPVINTGGKFAFRQQNNLHRGDYRNLRVYRLDDCGCDTSEKLPPVREVDLNKTDLNHFSEEEWFVPYYLRHFAAVANSVADTGENRGYFNVSVWRGTHNHHPYNARIMEGILSLAWFYTTNRPWNIYYKDEALKRRIEAALNFWCKIQSKDGKFSEYGPKRWSLAPTAFATKFVGRALWLLQKSGAPIDKECFGEAQTALRKALYIGFTDEQFWQHGCTYTNQYANFWSGALMYLDLWPDPEIKSLLTKRLNQSMTAFQSSTGFFYEKGGPDWGYNLSTHHSDLQSAWDFAKGTEYEALIVKKTADWYDWFAYNAVKEPGSFVYYLNRAVETRQQKGYYDPTNLEDPASMRWTPQAEFVPQAHAFEMSEAEYKQALTQAWQQMAGRYPEVPELKAGDFSTFSPYAFLHHGMQLWLPSEQQKKKAIENLPYLKSNQFNHIRYDTRNETSYAFIRKPGYYAIFNSGKIITEQQRYGLGLVWNPESGTIIQSQSKSDQASFGTKAEGSSQVYEAEDLIPAIQLNKKEIQPEVGNFDLPEGEITISYPLKELGKKKIQFKKDRIIVQIEHPGNFTEILPLLIGPDDSLNIGKKKITLTHGKTSLVIRLKGNNRIDSAPYQANTMKKQLNVIEISASEKLEYQLLFSKN